MEGGGGGGGLVGGRCVCLCGLTVGGVRVVVVCVCGGLIDGMPGGLEGKPSGSVARVCVGVDALLVVMWSPGGGEKVEASCGVGCRGCCGVVSCSGGCSVMLLMNESINWYVR